MNINNEPRWIEVTCEGEFTGAKYHGRFQVKPYLTLAERADAARLAGTFTRGISPDDVMMRSLLAATATLKFHILKADADWWTDDGLQLQDESPIMELVKAVQDIQRPKKDEENKDNSL